MRLRLRTVPALALTAILLATGPFATPAAANGTSPALTTNTTAIDEPGVVSCEVSYQIQAQWQGGFMAAVTVTNAGTVPVTWSVTIVYGDAGISNGWYAVFAQTGSSTWVVTPPPWQPTLPPGASATQRPAPAAWWGSGGSWVRNCPTFPYARSPASPPGW